MPTISTTTGQQQSPGLKGYQHPEFRLMYPTWVKWRLCYEGGDDFKSQYLYRYSKREDATDFAQRARLTYVPGHSRAVINIVRNALAVLMPEVVRKGSQPYLDEMARNVDLYQNSMSSFLAVEVIPWLLVQSKVFVVVDAPPAKPGVTLAEDDGRPFLYSVSAENVLSWAYDSWGRLVAILMLLYEDVIDPTTKLVVNVRPIYRYMRLLEPGEPLDTNSGQLVGPGVAVKTMDAMGKETSEAYLLQIPRVPVTEIRMVASLMGEIADHQITLLNLASTDIDFLWRSNFPIYTEQLPRAAGLIKPRGTKTQSDSTGAEAEPEPGAGKNDRQRQAGAAKGVGYKEGMERPGFINPSPENLSAAMEKEEAIIREIRVLVDLALASLSVKALEQSGASKQADRVGEEAGLAYIGRVLESGERDVAALWAMLEGLNPDDTEVRYPTNYTLKDADERMEEAERLRKIHSAVRSKTYQHIVDARVAELVVKPISTNEQLEQVNREIEENAFVDDDAERAEVVQRDAVSGLVSKETASAVRGYGPEEAAKVRAEQEANVQAMTGGGIGGEGAP